MKTKVLLVTLLAMALVACNNTNTTENQVTPEPVEQTVDALGTLITADGLENLQLGSKIPDKIAGYNIKAKSTIYEEEGEEYEEIAVYVMKDDAAILVIYPAYEDETDAPSDFIGSMTFFSDRFVTADGFRVGTNVQDILNKEGVKTFFDEEYFYIINKGIDYILYVDDYNGELPVVPFDIMTEVENPTFKADAKVREIRLNY